VRRPGPLRRPFCLPCRMGWRRWRNSLGSLTSSPLGCPVIFHPDARLPSSLVGSATIATALAGACALCLPSWLLTCLLERSSLQRHRTERMRSESQARTVLHRHPPELSWLCRPHHPGHNPVAAGTDEDLPNSSGAGSLSVVIARVRFATHAALVNSEFFIIGIGAFALISPERAPFFYRRFVRAISVWR